MFYRKRQGYHILHVLCIKQDHSVVVINLEQVTFDLLFKILTLFITLYHMKRYDFLGPLPSCDYHKAWV